MLTPRMRRALTHVLVAAIPMLAVAGCGGGSRSGDAGQAGVDSAARAADIDRLRSLPYLGFTDQPVPREETGTVVFDSVRSYPGYNLYEVPEMAMAELVDARGRLLHRWQGPAGVWARCVLLPNGDLLVVGRTTPRERYVARLAWDGSVRWQRDLPSHHDIGVTPDGRLMVLVMQARDDITEGFLVRDDLVAILAQDGTVVDYRSLYDMMSGQPDRFTFQTVKPRGRSIDLFHANSVRWMTHANLWGRHPVYARGNIIVCSRHQNTVAVLDWDRRELVWAWGQGEISGPHDAAVLENGHFLIFDNGLGRGWSRVIELDPLTKRIVWEYHAPVPGDFNTEGRGASQRLPNGNTLITDSGRGRGFEVTPDGEVVWEYFNPHRDEAGRRAAFVRLYRYERSFVEPLLQKAPKPL